MADAPPAERSSTRLMATRDRNTERLEELVREHHAFVWRSVRRLRVREADVDDVVQEVFVSAARHLDDMTHVRGYLFRACVYASAHSRRSLLRRREVVDDARVAAEVDRGASPEENAEQSRAREVLQRILDEMPDELRTIFVLFELERLSMIEIAEMLTVPAGTVASRLRRAREIFLAAAAAARTEEGESR